MQIVLSASRRTDIPAFYMEWFMAGIARGRFSVRHPYTGAVRVVGAGTDRVHSIVFWSKDFSAFLAAGCGERLRQAGYPLFFNFTVNSADRLLEPRVPALQDRLDQMRELALRFGPETVQWRFDPICFYQKAPDAIADNLQDFERIADAAAGCGVARCVTSFVDRYAKVRRREAAAGGFSFIDPPVEEKASVLQCMADRLADRRIALLTCCEPEAAACADPQKGIEAAACIPSGLLMQLFGGRLSLRKDGGQRLSRGCGCRVSVDIGSYREQPCGHRCLYCYAS